MSQWVILLLFGLLLMAIGNSNDIQRQQCVEVCEVRE